MPRRRARLKGTAARLSAILALMLGLVWSVACFGQVVKFLNWNAGWRTAQAKGDAGATAEIVAQKVAKNNADATRWAVAGLPGLWMLLFGGCAMAVLYRLRGSGVRVSSRYIVDPPAAVVAEKSVAER